MPTSRETMFILQYLADLIHHLLILFSFLSKRQQTEVPTKINVLLALKASKTIVALKTHSAM